MPDMVAIGPLRHLPSALAPRHIHRKPRRLASCCACCGTSRMIRTDASVPRAHPSVRRGHTLQTAPKRTLRRRRCVRGFQLRLASSATSMKRKEKRRDHAHKGNATSAPTSSTHVQFERNPSLPVSQHVRFEVLDEPTPPCACVCAKMDEWMEAQDGRSARVCTVGRAARGEKDG
mmetsp:Transcript_3782/g.23885  ORF Transcript_3782/g.23885 Transcript_3782/m.23885 type:complete len:175 (-) Transcript_3782:1440-1964(-)